MQKPQQVTELRNAIETYQGELENMGYTPLTISSYTSAANRFVDFLEVGEVIPDFDNKDK